MDNKSDIVLPCDLAVERTLLGAVLRNNDAWEQVSQLAPSDWSLDSHKRIRQSMKRLRDAGSAIDELTLCNDLRARGELEAVGGAAYICDLQEGVYRNIALEDHLRIARDKGMLRRLILICSSAVTQAADQSETALEVLGATQTKLEHLGDGYRTSTSGPVVRFISDAFARDEEEYRDKGGRHIPSGNAWFDAQTGGGYRCGRITLVCARPGVGKSAWSLMSAAYNCLRGNRSVIFSLEMEKEEIVHGLIPYLVDVPNIVVDRPELRTPEQHGLIRSAYSRILDEWEHLLSIYDEEYDVDQICWTIDRETSKDNENKDTLLVIDHFGLISGGSKNAVERETENSGRLRAKIKKKRHAALLDLMQFRKARNMEESNSAPTRDDVKGAGRIFEDAFACLILHREIDKDTRKMSSDALLDLCKLRRGGSTGSVRGKFDTRRLSFIAEPALDYDAREWHQ